MKMRVEVTRAVPVLLFSRVKLNGLSVGVRSRRLWVRAPSRAPVWKKEGRVSATEERLSYKQATRVRLLHPAPNFYPGIAQLAEHAIDNREIVGSTPTPWTIFERASPSGKAPGFQPGTAWVRIPPPAPPVAIRGGNMYSRKVRQALSKLRDRLTRELKVAVGPG